MSAVIFILLNSPKGRAFKKFVSDEIEKSKAAGKAIVACADSGAELAFPDIKPDFIIGDLDSISRKTKAFYEDAGVEFIKYPADKDFTDFHLALEKACETAGGNAKKIEVFGGLGRRLDHTLANIYVAAAFQNDRKIPVAMHESGTHVYTASSDFSNPLRVEEFIGPGDTVTLRPLFNSVLIEKTLGLKYAVNDGKLETFESRGTSNVATGSETSVKIRKGELLLVHVEKRRKLKKRFEFE